MKAIHIDHLTIAHRDRVLVDLSFTIEHSRALVGQSGSGKSLTLKALLGLSDPSLEVSLRYRSDFVWRLGDTVGFVPQNPFTALSPLSRIKDQFFIPRDACERLFGLLDLDPHLLDRFPPELSGGQLQRVVVGMALSTSPKLLLLDEPTTALDSLSKETMIALLQTLQKQMGFAMLFVTHDLGVAAAVCESMSVIAQGRMVEQGDAQALLTHPQEPYTQALLNAEFTHRGFRI